jgi:RNA polymerase sigma factor (sigma-70 family)
MQEGRISLLVALNSYAITKGSFYWWANHYIKTKLSREANKHSDVKIPLAIANDLTPMKVSIDNMFKERESSNEPLVDTQYDSKIISDTLKEFFETLDEKGKALISVTIEYGEASKKFDEICDEFGISKREGRKTLRVLREDLRQSLNNGEARI